MLGGGDLPSYLISLLLSLPIVLLALSVHEAAHGFAAWRLGDPTARNFGRLTLNPFKHLDPYGFICMLLVGFGWANPVPVNSRFFKKPRRDIALVGLAGPLSNLLLAVVFLLLLRFIGFGWLAQLPISGQLQFNLIYFTCLLLYYGVYMNVTLAIFNLLPVPPLDGSRIFYIFLPPRLYYKIMQHQRTITIVVMALLLLGPLSMLINLLSELIISGLFALTGMSGFLI
ncbi:MAG: site-2 protease family protein [Ruminococcaceae bacterium]|nr:site-2 protease family protein [Oscillospiraceae bacterium]